MQGEVDEREITELEHQMDKWEQEIEKKEQMLNFAMTKAREYFTDTEQLDYVAHERLALIRQNIEDLEQRISVDGQVSAHGEKTLHELREQAKKVQRDLAKIRKFSERDQPDNSELLNELKIRVERLEGRR